MSGAYIVTGASRGLGAAICSQLSSLGHKVLATARSESDLERLWKANDNVAYLACDLSQIDTPRQIVERAVELFGAVHGIVNNAGTINPIAPLAEGDRQAWARAITLNLTTPSLLMAEAMKQLAANNGVVVNISTGAAVKVVNGWSAYCASKAGLLHLTTVAASENPSVRFFSLRPGVIDTAMQRQIRESDGMEDADKAKFRDLKEGGKLEPPEVPARSAVWLLLEGPKERSGEFIQYTDPQVVAGSDKLFASLPKT